MKVPTGGTAHEPQGMIRWNSEADSTVWMKEEESNICLFFMLWNDVISLRIFYFKEQMGTTNDAQLL